jgi:hypothetical protein
MGVIGRYRERGLARRLRSLLGLLESHECGRRFEGYPIESEVVVGKLVSRRGGRVVCPSRANMFSFVPFRCTGGDLILLRIARQGSGGELIGRGKGEGEFGSVGRRVGMVWYGTWVMSRVSRARRLGEWACLGRGRRESVMSGSRG